MIPKTMKLTQNKPLINITNVVYPPTGLSINHNTNEYMATIMLNKPESNPLHKPNFNGTLDSVEMAEKESVNNLKKEYLLFPATLSGALKAMVALLKPIICINPLIKRVLSR